MSRSAPTDRIRTELRFLKMYAVLSTVVLAGLVVVSFRESRVSRFDVIDVERINVLNAGGLPALVIAGQGRLPGPTFEGHEYPQELSGGRLTASGMIFFNERGDEVGGLTFHGQTEGDAYSANGGITFDQFRQDQVVSLQYGDNGTNRRAGVHVWDRSTDVGLAELLPLVESRASATGEVRDSLDAVLQSLAANGLGVHRIFLGSQNRTAVLRLENTSGRPRIRMYVDSLNVARLEFLDDEGNVTHAIPE